MRVLPSALFHQAIRIFGQMATPVWGLLGVEAAGVALD